MNCYECGGSYLQKNDLLEIEDLFAGKIVIKGITYYRCDKCDDILYTEEMSRAIEAERNKLINGYLLQFPIGDFVGAAETASILGISRQALHKNRRIKHGFIFQTKFSGLMVYLKQSVLQYKKTGDGRFPLHHVVQDPISYATVKRSTSYRSSATPEERHTQKNYGLTGRVREHHDK